MTTGSIGDQRPGFRGAVDRLAAAQKPGRGAPPYSRWINRRLGRLLAAGAYVLGRTPDQVTVLSALSSLLGILVIALVVPTWWSGLLIAFFLVLGYALDAADGQLARLRGGGSLSGEWLDHVVDAAKVCLLHSAVAVSFYRTGLLPAWTLLLPLGFQAVSTVFFFTFILMEKLRRGAGLQAHRGNEAGRGLIQTVLAAPTDYGLLCVVFVFFGWPALFAVAYGLLFAAAGLVLLVALVRWWRELRALDRARVIA